MSRIAEWKGSPMRLNPLVTLDQLGYIMLALQGIAIVVVLLLKYLN
jgi:hypothetical protein